MEYTWFDLVTIAGISGLIVWAACWVYYRHKTRLHNEASVNLITGLEIQHKADLAEIESDLSEKRRELGDCSAAWEALLVDRDANWMRKPTYSRDEHGCFARKGVVYDDVRQEQ